MSALAKFAGKVPSWLYATVLLYVLASAGMLYQRLLGNAQGRAEVQGCGMPTRRPARQRKRKRWRSALPRTWRKLGNRPPMRWPSRKPTMKKSMMCALALLLLSACASPPSVQVLDLPPRPVPVAPKEALQPIPPAGYFLTRWREIFKP